MTASALECGSVEQLNVGGSEVDYVAADGSETRIALSDAWAVPLEAGSPMRRFPAHKGQRHLSRLWWSASTGSHVGFESWLERDHVIRLDFDPDVVGIASQPFWPRWTDQQGDRFEHAPDFFARRADGSALVMDCRPVDRRRPRDVTKFAATARACELVGWQHALVGAAVPVASANLRWLSGYRHPRHRVSVVADDLSAVFAVRPCCLSNNRALPAGGANSKRRNDRSATWFSVNRRGGTVILHNRHIRAVPARAWAPPMDGITATIWASGTTQTIGNNEVSSDLRPSNLERVGSTQESASVLNAASALLARHC